MSSPDLLPVAILAGGLATRLHPITQTIPKALVPVAGEPFLFHQLRYLRAQGVRRVVICTGYLGEMIEEAVGSGGAFGLHVEVARDGDKLLGTGGALKAALPRLGASFFVLYGDSFLPCDFGAAQNAFFASGKPALMTIIDNHNRWDRSNIDYRDGRLVKYDKLNPSADMHHIDYGLGVLAASVFDSYPSGQAFDLASVYTGLSESGSLAALEVFERFYEIGSHRGLKETQEYFAAHLQTEQSGDSR